MNTTLPYILAAEDDEDDQMLLQTVLAEDGFKAELEFVNNGVELMKKLASIEKYPSLILLDLNMPKMDGREALKKIKENPAYAQIPVIIFSTTKNEKEIKLCYELGASSYLVKPSTYNSFLEVIDSIKKFCNNILHGDQNLSLR
jgi:CheY-like chemotaxis protein